MSASALLLEPVAPTNAEKGRTCSVDGCSEERYRREWCPNHYRRWKIYSDPLGRPVQIDIRIRFLDQVEIDPSGCWLWTGAVNRQGYGITNTGGGRRETRHVLAHRFAYEMFVGPIPHGLVLDHVWANGCRHHNCVNWVDHLEPVTQAENMRRSAGLNRVTHCKYGHAFDEANTYITPSTGARQCRTCRAAAGARRRAAAKAAR